MINKVLRFLSNNTWYLSAHKCLFTLALVLQLGGVDDSVRLVDRVVAVQAAVVRHTGVPIDIIFTSFLLLVLLVLTFFLFLWIFVITHINWSARVPVSIYTF